MPTAIITTDDLREFKMELLQVSPGTLQNLRINGTLPYTKVGGIIYYDAAEIQNVMDANRVQHGLNL